MIRFLAIGSSALLISSALTSASLVALERFEYLPGTSLDGSNVTVGVDEFAPEKLPSLLKLKYHNAIAHAVADLGPPSEISPAFTGFQQYLYPREYT